MPKTPEQNQLIKEQRKQNILLTALRLFSIRGYDSVVVGDITKEAHCSHGLFYHYYRNKADVFFDLLKMAEEYEILKRNKSDNFVGMKAIDGVRLIVDNMLQDIYKMDEAPYLLNMFMNMHLQKTLPITIESDKKKNRISFFDFFVELIIRGQKEGDIAGGEPREYAIIYFSTIKGLCYTRLSMTEKATRPSSDIIMNLFTRKGSY
ncbi:MAG: TetR/AcrR family transcriptional regulator [Bacilli bacterium]|jgi:AcrR family transcriptional regulator